MQTVEKAKGFAYENAHTNPMIRKIIHIEETSEDHATYSSIGNKCAFFLAMIIVGVLLFGLLQAASPSTSLEIEEGMTITISVAALLAGVLFLLLFAIMPFVAMLIKKTIPVTGALYCMSVGYTISLLSLCIPEYQEAVDLALILTVAIVAAMALVYARGWIKVDEKFRNVAKILFFSSIGASILFPICTLIPQLRGAALLIAENPVISIVIALIYVVAAALFLLVDFNAIHMAVENKIPRKYEWIAAFGLSFSVIWLFLKVLDVILKAKSRSSRSKSR